MKSSDKLTDEVKTFVVQSLACFDPPSVVAKAVRDEFGVEIARQSVEAYDPTKRAGRDVAKRWREIFEATRKTFLEDTAHIAVSHRSVRLRTLQRIAAKAEEIRNFPLVAQLLEQAAKECGNAYTNKQRVEHTGKDGSPIETDSTIRVEFVRPRKLLDAVDPGPGGV